MKDDIKKIVICSSNI